MSYTYCPNEIAYAGEKGIVENLDEFIGFGGEMEPDSNEILERSTLLSKWRDICRKKISEAYDEYMIFKKSIEKERQYKKFVEMLLENPQTFCISIE